MRGNFPFDKRPFIVVYFIKNDETNDKAKTEAKIDPLLSTNKTRLKFVGRSKTSESGTCAAKFYFDIFR